MMNGGCLCGAVRYEVQGDPAFSGICHCSDCQKATGSSHVAIMAVPEAAVKITGETKGFEVVGESQGTISRNFCPTCGSLLFSKPSRMAGIILLTAGTLDDPSTYKPQVVIYTRSRPEWAKLSGGLPEFEGAPPPPPSGAGG